MKSHPLLRVAVAACLCALLGCGSGGSSDAESAHWRVTGGIAMPGRVTAMILTGAGDTLYVTCEDRRGIEGVLIVLDVADRRIDATYQLAAGAPYVDSLDEETGLLALRENSTVSVFDPTTGVERALLNSNRGFQRSVIANGFLYAPETNGVFVHYAALDGSSGGAIRVDHTGNFGLRLGGRTPSGNEVIVYSVSERAIQIIDTASNTVTSSLATAREPMEMLAISDTRVMTGGEGYLASADLMNPSEPPQTTLLEPAYPLADIVLVPASSLAILVRIFAGPITSFPDLGIVAPASYAEIGIVDVATLAVSRQQLFDDVDAVPYGFFSAAVTPDLSTVLLGRDDEIVFLAPKEPL